MPKLCRKNGGSIEQIKFLPGHSSIQTTKRYLGSEQEIELAVKQVGVRIRRVCHGDANLRLDCSDSGFWRARTVGLAVQSAPRLAYF
jgi:hypothetical protein